MLLLIASLLVLFHGLFLLLTACPFPLLLFLKAVGTMSGRKYPSSVLLMLNILKLTGFAVVVVVVAAVLL